MLYWIKNSTNFLHFLAEWGRRRNGNHRARINANTPHTMFGRN